MVDLVVLDRLLRARSKKKVEEKSAPADKILATPMPTAPSYLTGSAPDHLAVFKGVYF